MMRCHLWTGVFLNLKQQGKNVHFSRAGGRQNPTEAIFSHIELKYNEDACRDSIYLLNIPYFLNFSHVLPRTTFLFFKIKDENIKRLKYSVELHLILLLFRL